MNILWLSWKDITHNNSGGAEISGEQHAIAWVNAGHKVHWVSTNYKNSERHTEKDGVTYEHIGQKWMWFLGIIHILFFFKWIAVWNKHYDLVIDEIHGPPLLTPLYVKKRKIVIIHEVAGDIWKKTVPFPISWIMQHVVEPLFFKVYNNVPIIAGSQTTIEDLQAIGIHRKNITFIPYGVTIPDTITEFPKEHNPTVIFLSQLRPMKGFDRVYQSFIEIQKQLPSIKLWVVGDDSLPYAQEFKEKVLQEQSDNQVKFFGKVSQEKKFELLSRAHLILHGSYKEGWGLVVIEANAVGTPAVVFDAAGLRNSIDNTKTGFIAKDQNEFVAQVVQLLTDNSQYSQIQQNARQWSKQFSWQNSTTESLKMINS